MMPKLRQTQQPLKFAIPLTITVMDLSMKDSTQPTTLIQMPMDMEMPLYRRLPVHNLKDTFQIQMTAMIVLLQLLPLRQKSAMVLTMIAMVQQMKRWNLPFTLIMIRMVLEIPINLTVVALNPNFIRPMTQTAMIHRTFLFQMPVKFATTSTIIVMELSMKVSPQMDCMQTSIIVALVAMIAVD